MKISNSNDRNKPRSLLIQTCTANCPELPFGILSPCFAVILILNIIFSDKNITEKLCYSRRNDTTKLFKIYSSIGGIDKIK